MEELQMKDLQMKGLQERLTDMLTSIKSSKRKQLDLSDINQKLKEYELALDGANIELRHLGSHNPTEKLEWKQILREHKTILKELRIKYEEISFKLNKDELFNDSKENDPDLETPEGLMQHGLETQAKSKESLQRTLGVIERTKEVGTDTVLKLEANTQQITGLYDQLESIESSLSRSTKIVRRIARKVATDKVVWICILIVMAVVIAIIVVKIKNSSSSNDNNNSSSSTGGSG